MELSLVLLGQDNEEIKPYPWRRVQEDLVPFFEARAYLFASVGRHDLALNDYATLYALASNCLYTGLWGTSVYENAMNVLNDASILGLSVDELRNRLNVNRAAKCKTKHFHPDKVKDMLEKTWCQVYFTRLHNAKDNLNELHNPDPDSPSP